MSTNKPLNKWQIAFKKIKRVLPKSSEDRINTIRMDLSNPSYIRDIATQQYIMDGKTYNTKRMSRVERDNVMLRYDAERGILLNKDGTTASTIGCTTKGQNDVLAFVMDLEGNIYVDTHPGTPAEGVLNITHASFLGGKPAEMAGIIGIANGKIQYIANDSGHYKPKKFNMYRGLQKLYEKCPNIFAERSYILFEPQKEFSTIKNFLVDGKLLAEEEKREMIEKLLLSDIMRGIVKPDSLPPLHQAALSGNTPNLEVMLSAESKVDVDQRDQFGNTALHYAMIKRNLDAINKLRRDNASLEIENRYGETPVDYGLKGSDVFVSPVFLPDSDMMNMGLKYQQIDTQDDIGNTALHYAMAMEETQKIAILMNAGANFMVPNKDGKVPLEYCSYDMSELSWYTLTRNIQGMRDIISAGADINEQDYFNNTALHYAVLAKDLGATELLLRRNADLEIKNCYMKTPLDYAKSNGIGIELSNSKNISSITQKKINLLLGDHPALITRSDSNQSR
jgi:ankyrin repeat protein